jgi:hypothetical protein
MNDIFVTIRLLHRGLLLVVAIAFVVNSNVAIPLPLNSAYWDFSRLATIQRSRDQFNFFVRCPAAPDSFEMRVWLKMDELDSIVRRLRRRVNECGEPTLYAYKGVDLAPRGMTIGDFASYYDTSTMVAFRVEIDSIRAALIARGGSSDCTPSDCFMAMTIDEVQIYDSAPHLRHPNQSRWEPGHITFRLPPEGSPEFKVGGRVSVGRVDFREFLHSRMRVALSAGRWRDYRYTPMYGFDYTWDLVADHSFNEGANLLRDRYFTQAPTEVVPGFNVPVDHVGLVLPAAALVLAIYLFMHARHAARDPRAKAIAAEFPWHPLFPDRFSIAVSFATLVVAPSFVPLIALAKVRWFPDDPLWQLASWEVALGVSCSVAIMVLGVLVFRIAAGLRQTTLSTEQSAGAGSKESNTGKED